MPTLAKARRVAEWKIMANTSEIMGQWKNVLGFGGKSWQVPLKNHLFEGYYTVCFNWRYPMGVQNQHPNNVGTSL